MTKKTQAKRAADPLSSFRSVSMQTMHDKVTKQEEQSAAMVGGKRHAGSGASRHCKSDASSEIWQIECKQTEKESMSIKLDWLKKIQIEASNKQKWAMMCIKIQDEDWVMVPKWIFEKGNWE